MKVAWWERELVLCQTIRDYTRAHGYAPTYRELGDLTGRASPNTIGLELVRLARNGLVTYRKGSPRTLQLTGAGKVLAEQGYTRPLFAVGE